MTQPITLAEHRRIHALIRADKAHTAEFRRTDGVLTISCKSWALHTADCNEQHAFRDGIARNTGSYSI